MENSKELFIKAFMEAEQISNAQFADKNVDITFSDSFEKKMNRLLEKDKKIRLSIRRNIRKGLLAAIIAIIIAFTGLMSVSATRTPFIEFIKKVFPQFNEITLSEESTPPVDIIETEYTITNLPEEFEITDYQKDNYSVFTVWKNKTGEEIVLFQNIIDTEININNEYNYQELVINGHEAYLNNYEFNSSLVWTNGNYWFRLNIPNSLIDEIINIAENISEKN